MSKKEDSLAALLKKKAGELLGKDEQEDQKSQQEAKEELAVEFKTEKPELNSIVYASVVNPDLGGQNFLLVKIKFDIVSGIAEIEGSEVLEQRVIGMRFPLDQENLKHYYEKSKEAKGKK